MILCFIDLHEKLTNHNIVVGLSGSLDCSVKMWNLDTGKVVDSFKLCAVGMNVC